MEPRIPLFVSAVFGVFLLGPSEQAIGQDQQAAAGLEEIIVTARRREESLMDTPVSISAFTSEELALRQIEESHEIADATPNLVYRTVSSSGNNVGIIFIRGIGQENPDPSLQSGVGTYIDGVYIANIQGALTDLVDTESISVLRGPQGTLFGRNTIGGALQITSVKPSEEFHGEVDLELGEFSYEKVKATVNVPFTDNFYGRFTVMSREEDGYIDTPLIPDDRGAPGDDTIAARAALRWMPTDTLTIDWSADVTERKATGVPVVLTNIFEEVPGQQPWFFNNIVAPTLGLQPVGDEFAVGAFENYLSFGTYIRPENNEIHGSTLTVEWDIADNLTFKSISSYREQDSVIGRDSDHTPALIGHQDIEFDGWQRTQEFQLLGDSLQGRLDWVAGLYHFEEDMLSPALVRFPLFHLLSGAHVKNKSNAVFGQFTYDVTDQLSLTIGARNTDEKFDSVTDDSIQYVTSVFCPTQIPGVPCPPGFAGYLDFPPNAFLLLPKGVVETDKSRTEPYLNLAYHFTDTLMGYISYAEGFKGGGFSQQVTIGRPPFVFGPEFAEVWELGVKWTGWDNRLRLTAAAFITDYLDRQVPATSLLGTITVNAGNAEHNGGELELTVAATDRLTLSAGVGHLQARYKSIRDIDILGDPAVVQLDVTNLPPDTPDWQTNASIMYRAPLAGGELIARLDHTYSDQYFGNAQNRPLTLVPSSSLFHGGLTYVHGSDRWEVALQARNLTDEFHVVNIGGTGTITATVMPPRQMHARFKYRF